MRKSLLVGATLSCVLIISPHVRARSPAPVAVPTFECVGLSWSPPEGAPGNPCAVRFRPVRGGAWRDGLPLWFDERDGEYRGSLVHLDAGTAYDVELSLSDPPASASLRTRTWSESFPIAETVLLPAVSEETLRITRSGSPDGYVLYTGARGSRARIDTRHGRDHNVEILASYVILRGLDLTGAREHAIRLYDGVHDVVIEDNDVSDWGEVATPQGWGGGFQSAIYSVARDLTRVIVQRNRIHHPRADSNNWMELYPGHSFHPRGPQAVSFFDSDGHHVIRYNRVESDSDHYFTDIFGAGTNFSTRGFPYRDSDIYGNHVSHCWDNAIEAEGGNENVRIWNNFIDWSYSHIAVASTATGPIYIWRNVSAVAQRSDLEPWTTGSRGSFLKTSDQAPSGGRIYVFHNTILQPPDPLGVSDPLGCANGLGVGGAMDNVTSRNNVLQVYRASRRSINDPNGDPLGDYDYDLFNGALVAAPGQEARGIRGEPVYAFTPSYALERGIGHFELARTSPGYDGGQRLANFNDGYTGVAPDVGAHEGGTAPMRFGTGAGARFVANGPAPPSWSLRATPNPFRPALAPTSFLDLPGHSTLNVYTVGGALVRTLKASRAGVVRWDGRANDGTPVTSGVYLVRVGSEGVLRSSKVIVRR